MFKLKLGLIAFGLMFIGLGLYTIVTGRMKWDADRTLVGTQARAAGAGSAAVGTVLLLIGSFVL
jgi:hypothetical protein